MARIDSAGAPVEAVAGDDAVAAGDATGSEPPSGIDSLLWQLSSSEERVALADSAVSAAAGVEIAQASSGGPDADVVDIYIGGGGEGISNEPLAEDIVGSAVWDYVEGHKASDANGTGRTVAYYHWSQLDAATERANNALASGKTVNVIGHSYGASTALAVANGIDPENGSIDLLVGVDPVRNPQPHLPRAHAYPEGRVERVVLIDDTSSESFPPTGTDLVELAGDALARQLGPFHLPLRGYGDDRTLDLVSDVGHENFRNMITTRLETEAGTVSPSIEEMLGTR